MAVLTEMMQTGLYTQELLPILYTHMVSMARTIRENLTAVDNFNVMAENAVLKYTIIRLENELATATNNLNELAGPSMPRSMTIMSSEIMIACAKLMAR